jgi:hypothetical protein
MQVILNIAEESHENVEVCFLNNCHSKFYRVCYSASGGIMQKGTKRRGCHIGA